MTNNPYTNTISNAPNIPPAIQATKIGILHFQEAIQEVKNQTVTPNPITPKKAHKSSGNISISKG
jgi:hypothetical protein